jgi:hypothetical protein
MGCAGGANGEHLRPSERDAPEPRNARDEAAREPDPVGQLGPPRGHDGGCPPGRGSDSWRRCAAAVAHGADARSRGSDAPRAAAGRLATAAAAPDHHRAGPPTAAAEGAALSAPPARRASSHAAGSRDARSGSPGCRAAAHGGAERGRVRARLSELSRPQPTRAPARFASMSSSWSSIHADGVREVMIVRRCSQRLRRSSSEAVSA